MPIMITLMGITGFNAWSPALQISHKMWALIIELACSSHLKHSPENQFRFVGHKINLLDLQQWPYISNPCIGMTSNLTAIISMNPTESALLKERSIKINTKQWLRSIRVADCMLVYNGDFSFFFFFFFPSTWLIETGSVIEILLVESSIYIYKMWPFWTP